LEDKALVIKARDYFKNHKFDIDKIYFDYKGKRFSGHGLMTWNPNDGFLIEAFLDERDHELNYDFGIIEIGKLGIFRKGDYTSLKIKICGFRLVVVPDIILRNEEENLLRKRLSVRASRVIFIPECRHEKRNWSGSAIYQTAKSVILPDKSIVRTSINSTLWSESWQTAAININDDERYIYALQQNDKKNIDLYWSHHTKTSKYYNWNLAEGFRDALSAWYGLGVNLLYRKISRGDKEFIEINRQRNLESLNWFLKPFGLQDSLKKSFLISYAEFLADATKEGYVCRKIVSQLFEASRQQTWQATELLMSTILEAALSTLEGVTYVDKGKGALWDKYAALKRFREKYFDRKWKKEVKRITNVHKALRDRNAHPDWLGTQSGYLSQSSRDQALDDMIFLSRVYGYMILALTGFKNLEPNFPPSHKEWQAPIMIFPPE